MADAITIKALQDASLDAKSLEEVVNGDEVKQVTTRKGETYPSVKKAVKTMFDNGGLPATPFATKALMTASALVDGDYAQVTDDTVDNGLYVKTAGAWVKSAYDPLTQAKSYTDVNKLDYKEINYKYSGNQVNAITNEKRFGAGIASTSKIVTSTIYDCAAIDVNTGDIIYVTNTAKNYSAQSGYGLQCYGTSLALAVEGQETPFTSEDVIMSNGDIAKKLTIGAGSKILVFNTRFELTVGSPVLMSWNIQYNKPSLSFDNGSRVVSGIRGMSLASPENPLETIPTVLDGNLYNGTDGIIVGSIVSKDFPSYVASPSMISFATKAKAGVKYYAKITDASNGAFAIAASDYTVDEIKAKKGGHADLNLTLLKIAPVLVDPDNLIYEIKIPESRPDTKSLLINIKVDYQFMLDLRSTFQFWEGAIGSSSSIPSINNINGNQLIDLEARDLIQKVSSAGGATKADGSGYVSLALKDKKVMTFGDSMTAGTRGGYQQYLENELLCVTENHGVNGHTTFDLRQKMLGLGSYPVIDYSTAEVVTMFIGTNNLTGGDEFWNNEDGMPIDSVYDHIADGTTAAYFASFPNTFMGHITPCIEYVKWKNPRCKIYLISPTYRNGNRDFLDAHLSGYKRTAELANAIYVNATQESGLSLKSDSVWSYDRLHFNELGNEIFGKYLAKQIASR